MAKALEINENIHELSDDEAHELFERQARRYLNMSGAAFIRRWDAGEYADGPEDPAVVRVSMLLPLGR